MIGTLMIDLVAGVARTRNATHLDRDQTGELDTHLAQLGCNGNEQAVETFGVDLRPESRSTASQFR